MSSDKRSMTMVESNTAKKVVEIIAYQLGIKESTVKPEMGMVELEADSLDAVELVMELEEEFDITIPDEDCEKWQTVGDAIKYVEGKV